jgi:dTDP-glucose 4,6-dehydratase
MSKNVLITGGAGFIGSNLADYFLARGHSVICIDNLITGSVSNIAHLTNKAFKFINLDVTNYIYTDDEID